VIAGESFVLVGQNSWTEWIFPIFLNQEKW